MNLPCIKIKINSCLPLQVLGGMLLMAACTVTTSNPIPVTFSVREDSITSKIIDLIYCERVNVSGIEKKTNGKHSVSELTIRIINPTNLPPDKSSQSALGLQIARIVKSPLENKDQFESFSVLFVFEDTQGGFSSSSYTSYSWNAKDI